MLFIGIVHNLHPESFATYAVAEQAALAQLRREGVIREVFRRIDGDGLFGILEADAVTDLRRQLDRLPLTSNGLVEWELIEVAAL